MASRGALVLTSFTAVLLAACFGSVDPNATSPPPSPKDVELAVVSTPPCVSPDAPRVFLQAIRRDEVKSGSWVTLEGTPHSSFTCKTRACGDANGLPCCATCHGRYVLGNEDNKEVAPVELLASDFECNSCEGFCSPFSREPEGRYRFVGTLRQKDGHWKLDVTAWCRLE